MFRFFVIVKTKPDEFPIIYLNNLPVPFTLLPFGTFRDGVESILLAGHSDPLAWAPDKSEEQRKEKRKNFARPKLGIISQTFKCKTSL